MPRQPKNHSDEIAKLLAKMAKMQERIEQQIDTKEAKRDMANARMLRKAGIHEQEPVVLQGAFLDLVERMKNQREVARLKERGEAFFREQPRPVRAAADSAPEPSAAGEVHSDAEAA